MSTSEDDWDDMVWDRIATVVANSIAFLSGPDAHQRNLEAQRYSPTISWINDLTDDHPFLNLNMILPREAALASLSWAGEAAQAGRGRGRGRGRGASEHSIR